MTTGHFLRKVRRECGTCRLGGFNFHTSTQASWASNLPWLRGRRKLHEWQRHPPITRRLAEGLLKLRPMASVWRRGGSGSVRLRISNKQKVTSLKNPTVRFPEELCGGGEAANYVGPVTAARWAASEGAPPAIGNIFRGGAAPRGQARF